MRVWILSLWLFALGTGLHAMPAGEFSGTWRTPSSGSDLGDAVLVLDVGRDVFHAQLRSDRVTLPRTRFTRGPSDGVYEGEVPGGVMDWLSLGSGPNPLQGKPLAWARLAEDGALNIYRFELAESGEFELIHVRLVVAAGTLELRLQQSGTADGMLELTAGLSRQ